MKYVYPDYAAQFHCIASHCKHSCCIGWEIDIDPDTLAFWQKPELNTRIDILSTISMENTPHFVLAEGERCPHLREDGLCRMILAYGDECLCDICREHPRFYNDYNGRQEMGLGMCCEEAARLLIRGEGPVQYIEQEDDPEEYEVQAGEKEEWENPDELETWMCSEAELEVLLALRKKITELLYSETVPIYDKLAIIAAWLGIKLPAITLSDVLEKYDTFEVLDPFWTTLLQNLKEKCSSASLSSLIDDHISCRIMDYFIYRYFAAEEREPKEAFLFACYSTLLIRCLEQVDDSGPEEHLRLYSGEIEYSDCNLDEGMLFFSGYVSGDTEG